MKWLQAAEYDVEKASGDVEIEVADGDDKIKLIWFDVTTFALLGFLAILDIYGEVTNLILMTSQNTAVYRYDRISMSASCNILDIAHW